MTRPSSGVRDHRRPLEKHRDRRTRLGAGLAAAAVAAGALTAGLAGAPSAGAMPQAAEPPYPTGGRLQPGDPALLASYEAGRYVVVLREPSAARYDGDVPGYPRTAPGKGASFDARAEKVERYAARLAEKQQRVADRVGARVEQHYALASNAFTATLTAKQATQLAGDREVLLLAEDVAREPATWSTPTALGLAGDGGVWQQLGGTGRAGDGVVVGVLDTGIWPESPSFAGEKLKSEPVGRWGLHRRGHDTVMTKADGGTFTGECETGTGWSINDCSTKVIAARYYPEAFKAVHPSSRADTEYLSPRDGNGHGSHVAGTAAGNHGIDVTVASTHFGAVSGVAPAAKIAAYKVCFDDDDPATGSCYTSATLAAVEDAVRDGVDVITYSIGGAQDTVLDPVQYAFAGAAAAGVFVAAAAGNDGPGTGTVAHASPWVTTVAAATHAAFENTLRLGDGTRLTGASLATALPSGQRPLVAAADVRLASADPARAALCYPGTLDPKKAAGLLVLCDRGEIARVDKSAEVRRAGGAGMALVNTKDSEGLEADFHAVPTVHLTAADGRRVRAYLAAEAGKAAAALERGDTRGGATTPVPQIGSFSSRGPSPAADGDLLKPDLAAPGVKVLAPVAPPSNGGRGYDLYSGTSMATPHVAGLAALVLADRPGWTPMAVKSAMMTTASDLRGPDGAPAADPFAQGAGHVDPRRFLDPGLVVTSDADDWAGFLQGQGLELGVAPLAASALNVPSIAQGQVTARTTVARTFTGLRPGTWTISADVPGFSVEHPAELTVTRAGEEVTVELTFVREDAPVAAFATGSVTLTGPTTVRLPVALRPVSVKAPETVRAGGTSGAVIVPLTGGITGSLPVATAGLARSEFAVGALGAGSYSTYTYLLDPGTQVARFDLDAHDDRADLDLYVYRLSADGSRLEEEVGRAASEAADESVTLTSPAPGRYFVVVDTYAVAPGTQQAGYRLDTYAVGATGGEGELTVTPQPVPLVSGVHSELSVRWSGLEEGNRYLGYLTYEGALRPTYLYVG